MKKNLFLLGIAMFVMSFSLFAQASETPVTLKISDPVVTADTYTISGKFIIVSFDSWGNKNHGCRGWGLCNAEWLYCTHNNVPVGCLGKSNVINTTIQYESTTNKYYIDILLSEAMNTTASDTYAFLPIAEDIDLNLDKSLGINSFIPQGNYPFNSSLGTYGGYRIFL